MQNDGDRQFQAPTDSNFGQPPFQDRETRRARKIRNAFATILVLIGVVAALAVWRYQDLAANSPADRVKKYLENATTYLSNSDYPAATIELKNVLAAQPMHVGARIMLGNAHFKSGHYSFAAKELEKARQLDAIAFNTDAAHLYVESLIRSGRSTDARAFIALQPDASARRWRGMAALALLQDVEFESAKKLLLEIVGRLESEGSETDDHRLFYYLSLAEYGLGSIDASDTAIDRAIAMHTGDPDYFSHLGTLEFARQKFDKAESNFQRALGLDRRSIGGLVGMARIEIRRDNFEEASKLLQKLPDGLTDDRVIHLHAIILEQTGKRSEAIALHEHILKSVPGYQNSLFALARLNLEESKNNQSIAYLNRLLHVNPNHTKGLQLQSRILIETNEIDQLKEIAAAHSDGQLHFDPVVAMEFGEGLLERGDYALSAAVFGGLLEQYPEAIRARTRLIQLSIENGDLIAARAGLEQLDSGLKTSTQIKALEALLLLHEGDADQATAILNAVQDENTNVAIIPIVRAAIMRATGVGDPLIQYVRAYEIDPNMEFIGLAVAEYFVRAGDVEKGESFYRRVLERNNGSVEGAMGLARLLVGTSRATEADAVLIAAQVASPQDYRLPLALARIKLTAPTNDSLRSAENYLAVAKDLATPSEPLVLQTEALLLTAKRDVDNSLEYFQGLAEANPNNVHLQYQLALAREQAGQLPAAIKLFEQILEKRPGHLQSLASLATVALNQSKTALAQRYLEKMTDTHPESIQTRIVAAKLAISEGVGQDSAVQRVRSAYNDKPSRSLAMTLHRLETTVHGHSSALTDWLAVHPKDVSVRMAYAQYLQMQSNFGAARREYENILDLSPNSAVALNNLAGILHKSGETRKATSFAAKAYDAAPLNPGVADTFGWLLVQRGSVERGLLVLKKALSIKPNDPDIAYHVASARARAGDKEGARMVLDTVLEEHRSFRSRNDALTLKSELK